MSTSLKYRFDEWNAGFNGNADDQLTPGSEQAIEPAQDGVDVGDVLQHLHAEDDVERPARPLIELRYSHKANACRAQASRAILDQIWRDLCADRFERRDA